MQIQFYNNVFEKTSEKSIKIFEYLENIKNGIWQDPILKYRAGKTKKTDIPCVTVSGTFKDVRNAQNIEKHSGLICMDCDSKDNPEILKIRDQLACDKFIFAFHISVGGFGLALYIKINPTKHLESFQAIGKYLADEYHITIDESCKDVSRLRFVSYDPELYINQNAEKWVQYLKKETIAPQRFNPVYAKDDINFCIDQICSRGIDLTQSYEDWINICFAFCSELGESGRNGFHNISKNNPKYNQSDCDKKYTNCLKTGSNRVGIGTFFWHCKNAGVQIKKNETKRIEEVARVRRKSIGKSGGSLSIESAKLDAEKHLQTIDNISTEKSFEIIEKVFQLSEKELNENQDGGELAQLIEYINSLDTKYNIVTKRTEILGIEINDKKENSVFLTAREMFPKGKITKDLISAILDSDRVKEYNPFLDFIEKNKHLKPQGTILKLFDCIRIPDNNYAQYVPIFIEKWLISIIASIHGTYSLLILVLIGEQATNKTNFFRFLLPDELQKYYAESKLDKGTDDELLMSKKLLIIDDEFGGKSKKEAEKLKDLSSKQTITARKSYGHYSEDYQRIAVLGGTSNETEVLNDSTGNRRIIPIKIINIDFEKYKLIDKTELFMELYWKWREVGDKWMLTKQEIEILNDNTTNFVEITMEEDLISKHFEPMNKNDYSSDFLTASEMMSFCESFLSKQKLYHKKFGQILRKLGFIRHFSNERKNYGYYCRRIG